MHVSIEPGSGLVGRFGDAVILIQRPGGASTDGGTGASSSNQSIKELVDLAATIGSDPTRSPRAIAVSFATWAISHSAVGGLGFGIVAPAQDDYVMFLSGPVKCSVTEKGATREISGEQALTWVDLVIPGTFERLALGGAAGGPVAVDPLSDLREGVVPGQGLVLTMVEVPGEPGWFAPAAASSAQPATDIPSPQAPVPQEGPSAKQGPMDDVYRQPTQVTRSGRRAAQAASSQAGPAQAGPVQAGTVQAGPPQAAPPQAGLVQARSAQSAPQPGGPAQGPHPLAATMVTKTPRGALRSDSGQVIILDRAYVLGRDPHLDSLVQSGAASPVQMKDPDKMLSRIHSYLTVDNRAVLVSDADSVNGTYISPPGAEEWTRIGTEPVELMPGWSLRLGTHVLIFELSDQPDAS